MTADAHMTTTNDVSDHHVTTATGPHPAEYRTTSTDNHATVHWDDLVAAALLGTERRTPPGAAPGAEPAAALLDAAAVATLRRRAGLRPAAARPRPAPAPADPRPPLPAAAHRRLTLLLADRLEPGSGGGRRGTAPDLTELLPQWLSAANRHGYRAPAALLPALLDAARARTDLRSAALTLAGPRALWLARANPDWRFALRGAVPPAAPEPSGPDTPPGPDHSSSGPQDPSGPAEAKTAGTAPAAAGATGATAPAAVRRLWEEGLFAERVALLETMRRREPAAALALLDATWRTERAEDRLMFLDSLRTGLSAADEPFLERALADRSRNVRATAAELLSALPGSAFAARMAARAVSCVLPAPDAPVPLITVVPPRVCDAAMQRDGVLPRPPSGRGERAWWLGQLVEAAPLSCWTERFGGRSAAEVTALPVADGWQPELHAAWCRAAVRQRNAEWSRALLGSPAAVRAADPGTASPGERTRLLSVLPPEERARWVAGFIAAHGLPEAFQLLGVCAVPWAAPLGRAVVDALDIAREAGSYPWSFSGVMGLAERCLDPVEAGRLELLTAATDEPEGASPGAGAYWSEAFQRLVRTLRLRRTMLDELAGLAECPEPAGDPGDP
ncbi:DUF5691 domain-containing protein [Streptomyces albus]|uniref:DUF5691 domain-containing protein n=1 Tax=Streptomyces albus TaxID=1888 RepID=UPI000AC287E3|nr:DUF5691 domain-containing protein [Streptomyces albus]